MKESIDLVMLVDDNDTDNFIHKRVIELTGFAKSIVVKNSGKSALEYLESNKNNISNLPDVIFLDINMPVMDGFEFIETFRELNMDTHKTRIIIYTASFTQKDVDMLKSIGFNDFIVKPLTEEKLVNVLKLFEEK